MRLPSHSDLADPYQQQQQQQQLGSLLDLPATNVAAGKKKQLEMQLFICNRNVDKSHSLMNVSNFKFEKIGSIGIAIPGGTMEIDPNSNELI